MEIDLEWVEVACDHNDFSLPVSKGFIIEFAADGDSCEKGQIGKRQVQLNKLFFEINKLYLQDLERFTALNVGEINNKQTISKLSDDNSVGVCQISVGKVSIGNEDKSSRPVIGSLKVITINEL